MDAVLRTSFLMGLLDCSEPEAKAWYEKLVADGRTLEDAIEEMIRRREAGLPFDEGLNR